MVALTSPLCYGRSRWLLQRLLLFPTRLWNSAPQGQYDMPPSRPPWPWQAELCLLGSQYVENPIWLKPGTPLSNLHPARFISQSPIPFHSWAGQGWIASQSRSPAVVMPHYSVLGGGRGADTNMHISVTSCLETQSPLCPSSPSHPSYFSTGVLSGRLFYLTQLLHFGHNRGLHTSGAEFCSV